MKSILLAAFMIVFIMTGCAAPSDGTTTAEPGTTTPGTGSTAPGTGSTNAGGDTITLEGVILTNGTVYIAKAPASAKLTDQLMTVQMPQKTEFIPGSLVEFVIQDAIRESYPLQASGISSRLIKETTSVLMAPIDLGPQMINHMPDDAMLIDVRTPQEFADGHIQGAVNIPLNDIQKLIGSQVPDKNATLLVYCRSGNRSSTAAKQLKKLNYNLVFDLGGINAFTGEQVKGAN